MFYAKLFTGLSYALQGVDAEIIILSNKDNF